MTYTVIANRVLRGSSPDSRVAEGLPLFLLDAHAHNITSGEKAASIAMKILHVEGTETHLTVADQNGDNYATLSKGKL